MSAADRCARCGGHVTHTAVYTKPNGARVVERVCEKDAKAIVKQYGRRKVAVHALTHTKEMQP